MEKTVVAKDYVVLLKILRKVRKRLNITQAEIGARLGMTQSMISKCERGERRLDVIELRRWCMEGMQIPLLQFLTEVETALARARKK